MTEAAFGSHSLCQDDIGSWTFMTVGYPRDGYTINQHTHTHARASTHARINLLNSLDCDKTVRK